MLSIGAAPHTGSPPQEGMHVPPQVFASCFSRDPTSVGWVSCYKVVALSHATKHYHIHCVLFGIQVR